MRIPELRVTAYRRSLAILATALVFVGCAAPATQESQSPSDPPAVTASASASATAAQSASSEPVAAPTPTLAFEPPDGILPPNSIVVVIVDALQLRAGPGLAAAETGLAFAGDQFSVAGWFGPVERDGVGWYRLGPAIGGDLDAWAAAGSGADRYLELVPTVCPSGDPDLTTLINMGTWDRLACFGDRSITLEGTFGCGVCDGTMAGDFQPFWLAWPLGGWYLWADFAAGVGPLPMRSPPEFELPAVGSIVRLTGHFSDPASTTCTMSTFVGEQATDVDQRTAELVCREQFVVDDLEVTGTDPTYSDPYNP